MMAEKAKLNDGDSLKKILNAKKPGEAKAIGRKVRHFNGSTWFKHRINIVVKGNYLKFIQNKELKRNALTNQWCDCDAFDFTVADFFGKTEDNH